MDSTHFFSGISQARGLKGYCGLLAAITARHRERRHGPIIRCINGRAVSEHLATLYPEARAAELLQLWTCAKFREFGQALFSRATLSSSR
jgi:hypothetical protein